MCTHSCLLYSFSSWGYSTAAQFLPMRGSSPEATRSTRNSRRFVSQSMSLWCPASSRVYVYVLRFRILCIRHFVINVINNIRIRFIISFYVICAVIYCSFYCIYVWLDPGTYMIARFMFFYKPGVTLSKLNLLVQGVYDMLDCGLWISHWVKDYKIAGLYGKYE